MTIPMPLLSDKNQPKSCQQYWTKRNSRKTKMFSFEKWVLYFLWLGVYSNSRDAFFSECQALTDGQQENEDFLNLLKTAMQKVKGKRATTGKEGAGK